MFPYLYFYGFIKSIRWSALLPSWKGLVTVGEAENINSSYLLSIYLFLSELVFQRMEFEAKPKFRVISPGAL